MWFEELMGFIENNPKSVRNNIKLKDNKLISKINHKEYIYGYLELPSLQELRNRVDFLDNYKSKITLSEVVEDIQELHCNKNNNGAFFQVASQFNLLEMASPDVSPVEGVGIYEYDYTQGPACAIACGAGTIYRNYFINIDGRIGQDSTHQIDCLKDIGEELGNNNNYLWEMSNGYVIANKDGLNKISDIIKSKSDNEYEQLKGKLRIGLQLNTEVTVNKSKNIVTQAYCSALPIAYSDIKKEVWETFARLILEATYEATFYSALLNYEKTKNSKVYLTLIGGGVFGNNKDWIFDAIKKSLNKFLKTPLEIKIVSYKSSDIEVKRFINSLINII